MKTVTSSMLSLILDSDCDDDLVSTTSMGVSVCCLQCGTIAQMTINADLAKKKIKCDLYDCKRKEKCLQKNEVFYGCEDCKNFDMCSACAKKRGLK